MALKPKYKNEVTLTLRISNDFGERKAVRKVSDKMIAISAYKNFGYSSEHKKNPPLNVDVMVFTGNAKKITETSFSRESAPKPGDYIDVTGSLSTEEYVDKNGTSHTQYRIYADKVDFSEMEEVEDKSCAENADIWGK